MRGLRNRLVHIFDYEQIDYDIIWIVATEELPALEPKIRSALSTISCTYPQTGQTHLLFIFDFPFRLQYMKMT